MSDAFKQRLAQHRRAEFAVIKPDSERSHDRKRAAFGGGDDAAEYSTENDNRQHQSELGVPKCVTMPLNFSRFSRGSL